MKDLFYEQMIKRKEVANPKLIRIAVIVLIAFLMTIGALVFGFISVVIAVVLGVASFFYIFPHSSMEYEYTLSNYDMDIDAIYNRSKRESIMSFDIRKAEMIAPKGSSKLAYFKPSKTMDFTSGNADARVYSIMINLDKVLYNILIEPDDQMLDNIRVWMGMRFSKN